MYLLVNNTLDESDNLRKMTISMLLLLYALVYYPVISKSDGILSWKLETVPAVFGEDVQLACFIPNYASRANMNRRWSIGRKIHGITLNGVSRYPNKYSEHMDEKNGVSTLRIHNFSLYDVNTIYECAYGFSIDRKFLNLSKIKFENHPIRLLNATVENDKKCTCRGNVTLENVFPQPDCKSTFNLMDITLSSLHVKTEQQGLFFTSEIMLIYTHRGDVETGKLIVVCEIGSKRFVVVNETLFCVSNGRTNLDIKRIAGITSVCVLMSIPMLCLIYVFSMKDKKKLKAWVYKFYLKKKLQGSEHSLQQYQKANEEMALQNDKEGVT
ncbi:uncharacterized protein LOC127717831 [Mytilus californianus]|uniref:uncharacterized protein LOC127717831 n=1 Tax=Mytilus californianus TaxID=6549 RepID=UPI0022450468|nr:uncharacterized protein LOC127717831 [Mytilus californianus]